MIFDIICIIIVLYFVIKGYLNGFIKDTFNLVKYFIIIYILVAYKEYIYKINDIYKLNINSKFLIFISFIVLYILFTLAINLVTRLVDMVGMAPINKWLGIIVAIIKSSIIVYIIYFCLIVSTKSIAYSQTILNTSNIANLIESTTINDNMITGQTRETYDKYIANKEEYLLGKDIMERIEKGE